ncbi:MAG: RNA polymerase subunit sigma-70, partial [Chitinophagaceae bacterium]|nr:RNA polymerase subunit sigma-70 [Rubrivivax sp.]
RLLAILAARTRDIAASEDALAEAFVAALRSWPDGGVPANPEAWLLTTARHSLRNAVRHQGVVDAAAIDLTLLADEAQPEVPGFPDERLKLLFVCAHPAIDEGARTPLMLQAVLGLDAAQIAGAFLVAPATMGQRLVRAKAKIRDARLRFELPTAEDMPERLADVLNAIYAAYGASWDGMAGADAGAHDLGDEAIFLCRLLVALLPEEPEARGLLALMLYCESRRLARRGPGGIFVPLKEQDTRLWSRDMIIEAEGLLTAASRAGVFGRFQCEAAIQSVHAQRPLTGSTNHAALTVLYRLLASHCPSIGVLVGQAAALVEAGHPSQALDILRRLDPADIKNHQPYWVTLAHALAAAGQAQAAEKARTTAIGLTEDAAIRQFLTRTARD